MLLHWILALPFLSAIALAFIPKGQARLALPLALLFSASMVVFGLVAVIGDFSPLTPALPWFALPGTGATVHFALYADGLSAWMILLTSVLTLSALWMSREQFAERFGFFAILVFVMQGAIFGCFLASDAVLFFLFFEALVPPTYLLIRAFGGPGRKRASVLFTAFTLAGSAPMAVALWAIAAWTGTTSGAEISGALAGLPLEKVSLLFFAFALAFAVKTPLFPFHGWQAETYSEAPAGVTALLSGAMAKVGIFGFLRWTIPLFPQSSMEYGKILVWMGLATIVLGSLLAWRQTDIKKILVYSSMAHLGLAVIGCFTLLQSAVDGVVVMMVAHGFSAGALFLLLSLPERWMGTRDIKAFGAFARTAPVYSVLFMAACLASVAVPGSLGFVAELLILQGVWQTMGPELAILAGLGAILGAAYTLRLIQAMLFGAAPSKESKQEIQSGDVFAIAPLVVALFLLGIAPSLVLQKIDPAANQTPSAVASAHTLSETDLHASSR